MARMALSPVPPHLRSGPPEMGQNEQVAIDYGDDGAPRDEREWFRKLGLVVLSMTSHWQLPNHKLGRRSKAAYLAGTSRSAGRGWPLRSPPPKF